MNKAVKISLLLLSASILIFFAIFASAVWYQAGWNHRYNASYTGTSGMPFLLNGSSGVNINGTIHWIWVSSNAALYITNYLNYTYANTLNRLPMDVENGTYTMGYNKSDVWVSGSAVAAAAVYHMNATPFDDALGAYDGLTGGGDPVTNQTCKFGACTDYDGNDYDALPLFGALVDGTNDFSISLWFNTDITPANNQYCGQLQGETALMFFKLSAGNSAQWTDGSWKFLSWDVDNFVKTDKWYLYTFTYDANGNITAYLNNTFQAALASSGDINTQALTSAIGAHFDGSEGCNIQIDELTVWNGVLNQAQINDLYSNGVGTQGLSPLGVIEDYVEDAPPPDTTPPTYTNNMTNDSAVYINDVVQFNVTWDDTESALGGFVFNHNITGVWRNESFNTTWGSNNESTYYYRVNVSQSKKVGWRVYANDSEGNMNETGIFEFTVLNTVPPQVTSWVTPAVDGDHNNVNIVFDWDPVVDADGATPTYYFFLNETLANASTGSSYTSTFPHEGNFTYIVGVDDGVVNGTNSTRQFFIYDTTAPAITVNTPANMSNFSNLLTDISNDILCTDSYPYVLNYTFYNTTGVLFSQQNATPVGTQLTIINTTEIGLYGDGAYKFNVSCSDSHTAKKWEPTLSSVDVSNGKELVLNGDKISITLKNIAKSNGMDVGDSAIGSFDLNKKDDRYTFDIKFTKKTKSFTFVITADKIVKINSDINGHLVINDKYWFDTEPYRPDSIEVSKDGKTAEIAISGFDTDNVITQSIGGLNIVEKVYHVNLDSTNPTVALNAPANNSWDLDGDVSFQYTATDTNIQTCKFYHNASGTWTANYTNSSPITGAQATITEALVNRDGIVWNVWCNDTSGNAAWAAANYTIKVDQDPPTVAGINWTTTGGSTGSPLTYNQILDYINATCDDPDTTDIIGCNISVYKPDGSLAVNKQPMEAFTTHGFNYSFDVTLNAAGNWSINITAWDKDGSQNTGNASSILTVATQDLSTTDGWYGCTNNTILSAARITEFSTYGCDLVEFNSSIQTLTADWNNILIAINNSRDANMHVGLNFLFNFNYTNTSSITDVKHNISTYFPDLTSSHYALTVEYISFELENASSYAAGDKDNALNGIAANATAATGNDFIFYSKGYNSTGLDNSYITYTEMNYLSASTADAIVQRENDLMRNTTSLNRMYVKLVDAIMTVTKTFQSTIIDILRGTPVFPRIADKRVAELSNYDVVLFNNASITTLISTNVTNITEIIGKDAWASIANRLIETNTDGIFSVNVSADYAEVVMFEDLDHVLLTTNDIGVLYKASAVSTKTFNYTNGTNGGSWGVDSDADEIRFEGFDPHYVINDFITYYGWFNASYINNWTSYTYLIFADFNKNEVGKVLSTTPATTGLYGYISVADFVNTDVWQTGKEAEVDAILALNVSTRLNIFIDGLDTGVGTANFSVRFKELVDYVKVTKERNVGINTYTAYENFCTWANPGGFCMKESCVRRWNGAVSATPDSYTWEDWDLEVNKSSWYDSHGIDVVCQAFDNRTTDTFEPLNWTRAQDTYFASRVLGYDHFYMSQPDFNYAHTEYFYDVGTDLAQDWSSDDNETYYRRYSNGIVYYNSSSNHGWIDDGRDTSVQVCFNLYDNSDVAGDEDRDFEFRVNNVSTTNYYRYNIPATQITAGVWGRHCVTLNESDESPTGSYKIEATTTEPGLPADAISIGWSSTPQYTGKHSWYSDTAGDPVWVVYPADQNWEISIIVNETKKTSLDTFSNVISQSTSWYDGRTNVTINATSPVGINVWSNVIVINGTELKNITYWNGTNVVGLGRINTTTCDTINPSFNVTNISNELHSVCFEQNSSNTIVRVIAPSLSARIYMIDSDLTSPVVALERPASGNLTADNTPTIAFNVSDAVSPSMACWLYFNITPFGYNGSTDRDKSTPMTTNATVPDGYYLWKVNCTDGSGNLGTSSSWNMTVDTTAPNVVFNYQSPADLNLSTFLGYGMNVSYNITDVVAVDASTATLYAKANTSLSDVMFYVNGTAYSGYTTNINPTNASEVFLWGLDDNRVLPGTYNFNETTMENYSVSSSTLTSANQYLSVELYNVSNTLQYSFFEIMANRTSGTGSLRFYYCNSTYGFSSSPASSGNCIEYATLSNNTYDHIHPGESRHMVIPFGINTSTNKIGSVAVTQKSYFVMRGISGTTWTYYYITNLSRTNATKTSSNNGNAWTPQTYTINAHLHQFTLNGSLGTNNSLYYYVCVNDSLDNQNCTSPREDAFGIGGLPPTAPSIIIPHNQTYGGGSIWINYTASTSPNGYDILHYNISLLYINETSRLVIRGNNSVNLSYLWDSTAVPDGSYRMSVKAKDSLSQTSIGLGEIFYLDNTAPTVTMVKPTNGAILIFNTPTNLTLNYTVSDVTNVTNCTLWFQGGANLTNTSIDTNGENVVFFNHSIYVGTYNWSVVCYDNVSNSNNQTTWTFTLANPSGASTGQTGGGAAASQSQTLYCERAGMVYNPVTDLCEMPGVTPEVTTEEQREGLVTGSISEQLAAAWGRVTTLFDNLMLKLVGREATPKEHLTILLFIVAGCLFVYNTKQSRHQKRQLTQKTHQEKVEEEKRQQQMRDKAKTRVGL